jgi:hypothetical protein
VEGIDTTNIRRQIFHMRGDLRSCEDPGMPLVEVSPGMSLAYETFGDLADPPVLLVMGFGAQMIAWHEDFCRALADRGRYRDSFAVLRPSGRGVKRIVWGRRGASSCRSGGGWVRLIRSGVVSVRC